MVGFIVHFDGFAVNIFVTNKTLSTATNASEAHECSLQTLVQLVPVTRNVLIRL
jgi:hypothetical protein